MERVFRRCSHIIMFCAGLFLFSESLFAQGEISAIELFPAGSVTHVVMMTDMRELVKQKFKEEYQPALVRIIRSPGDTIDFDLEIRSRGNIRKEVCYFPPIFVKFPKQSFSYHKLKWVNVCRDSDENEAFLLKEYMIYRMFRTLTDMSLDARLIRVEYIDSSNKNKPFSRYAFVIQSEEELAETSGGRVYEPVLLKPEFLNKEQLAVVCFFEYMIGNTDWELLNLHNILVFTHDESRTLMPVAYDFDYSGLVGAPYAVPHESMPIKSVYERYNKGYCIDIPLCQSTRQLFIDKKAALLESCSELERISEKEAEACRKYLEAFFKEIESPKRAERIFAKDCKVLD